MKKMLRYIPLTFIFTLFFSYSILAQSNLNPLAEYNFSSDGGPDDIPNIKITETPNAPHPGLRLTFISHTKDYPITELEYFFNIDPGFGNGKKGEVFTSDEQNKYSTTIQNTHDTNTNCNTDNTLYVRVKDSRGKWSLYDYRKVNVYDKTPPTIISVTPPKTIKVNNEGTGTLSLQDIQYKVTDNCSEVSPIFMPVVVDCSQVGDVLDLSISFTDDSGNNTEPYDFKVKVVDETKPVANQNNFSPILQLESNGKLTIDSAKAKEIFDDGSTDNCEIVKYEIIPNTFDCSDLGPHEITYRVTDKSGNFDEVKTTMLLEGDNGSTSPIAKTKNITIKLNESGAAKIKPEDINATETSACGYDLSIDKDTFICWNLGKNSVELTVKNDAGSDTAIAIVTVVDEIAPKLTLNKPIVVELDNNGVGTLSLEKIDYSVTENCTDYKIDFPNKEYTCEDIGKSKISIPLKDNSGNDGSSTHPIEIIDNINPIAITKNITKQLDASGKISITTNDIDNGSSDNCKIKDYKLDKDTFTCDDIGENTVTLTVTDESGNSHKSTATVTITGETGNTKPIAQAKDIEVLLDEEGKAIIKPSDINENESTLCTFDVTISKDTFTCNDIGKKNEVILTVSNKNGSDNDTAIITVLDKLAPTINSKDSVSISLEANGEVKLSTETIEINSKDNCGIKKQTLSKSLFTCDDVGKTTTVEYRIEDIHGNIAKKDIKVTIIDDVAPIALAKDLSIKLSKSGTATITTKDVDNGSSDNCNIAEMTLSKDTFGCEDLGKTIPVTLTVTDDGGKSSTATANITVTGENGDTNPVAKAKNITKFLNADGTVTITADEVYDSEASICSFNASINKDIFTCEDIGNGNKVTLTVTGNNGNSSTDVATVTIIDNLPPVITPKNSLIFPINKDGVAIIKVEDVVENIQDNCKIKNTTVSPSSVKCTDAVNGKVTIIITSEDTSGNAVEKDLEIELQDDLSPVVITKNIIKPLASNGTVTILPEEVNNDSSDNCGIASMTLDKDTFNCDDVGKEFTVTLTVTDFNNNQSSETATVTIEGNSNPIAEAKNITVQLDENGTATITPKDIDANGATFCATNAKLDKSTFTCDNIGDNEITLTITGSNSSSSDKAIVTVEDNISPVAIAKESTIILINAGGKAILNASSLNNNSTDNCGIVEHIVDKTTFTCENLGENTVNYTVVDASGNTDITTATVIIKDNTKPTVLTKDITIELDENGKATITPTDIDNGSTYGCSFTATLDKSTFDCNDIGEQTVTLTVNSGANSSTGTAKVTVKDNIAPTLITKNITVQLNDDGYIVIEPKDIDTGSYDNCTIANMSLDKSSFACNNIGDNVVRLTAVDHSGNEASYAVVVTVEGTGGVPDIETRDITIQLDENGEASIIPEQINNVDTVNCSFTSEVNQSTFTCSHIGENTITLTLTGKNGNSKSGVAIVTVEDSEKPRIVTKDITVNLDGNESVAIKAQDIDGGSSDNCGIANWEINLSSFNKAGQYPVILTVTDDSGNSNVSSAIVTVINGDLSDNVIMHPNPVKDVVNIITDKPLKNVSIYNVSGQTLMSLEIKESTSVDISSFAKGLYFFKFTTMDDKEIIKKVRKD